MPVRVPVGSSDYPSVMDLLQLPTFCNCNNLHDRSATFCISVLQKTNIYVRMIDTVTHARLGSQIGDDIKRVFSKQIINKVFVCNTAPDKTIFTLSVKLSFLVFFAAVCF